MDNASARRGGRGRIAIRRTNASMIACPRHAWCMIHSRSASAPRRRNEAGMIALSYSASMIAPIMVSTNYPSIKVIAFMDTVSATRDTSA